MVILAYLTSIVLVNFMFAHTGPHIGAVFVGAIFVLRDYVQKEIGHSVLIVMTIGCAISFYVASPMVATASASAFIAAEFMDWFVFTALRLKFHNRVLFSSVVGVAVDSLIFYPMIGVPLFPIVLVAWFSKMVAAASVWGYYVYEISYRRQFKSN